MTVLQALEEANQIPGIKGLSFASLQEFNSFKDSFNFLDWPRNIMAPFALDGTVEPHRTSEIIIVEGFMLTRINEDTNDFRSVKIEPDFIEPMRKAARKFILGLVNSDLTNPQVSNINYRIFPQYQFMDAHLFGVQYWLRWPVNGKLCL